MAEAIGGAFLSAFLSAFFNVLLERMASREFSDFIKGRKISDNLFKKLNARMLSVNEVLDDAEDKQITNLGVRKWLDELKHALYDADDFVDEIAYKVFRSKIGPRQHRYVDQTRNFLAARNPFRKGMDSRLTEILDRLEYLVEQKDQLSLTKCSGEKLKFKSSSHMRPTTSLVDESGVFGRDADKEAIVKLLLSEEANGDNVSVIPIVGMGGIGKTTLVQVVYNDSRVQERFKVKAWTCVLEEFDVFKVTEDVLKEVSSLSCETDTPNQLQLKLKERLMGKRFLIVLDDVWNVSSDDWELLQKPFKFGANGSKIVVTTRMDNVASIMRTVPTHHLKGLNDHDCWSLFSRHAFNDENSSTHPVLEEIGREIVKKCEGLPLAAKALGSLLRTKRDFEEWEKILKSSLWDLPNENVLPALRLSYHYLPSHLKRCFAYCAIFPKDYEFEKEELVRLWMAEGFLVHSSQDKDMEEVGDEYFNDLVSRSFFQRSSGYRPCFIMHDLMNDLAKFVSGEFCFRLEGDNTSKVTEKTRHLSYVRTENDSSKRFEGIYEAQLLRTIILVGWSCIDNEVMHDLLLKFRQLRVLSLSQYCSVAELPKSIGKLKHLRYLDLSTASMKELPDIVTTLYNLQTLILHECKYLTLLPDSIGDLKYLRYFDLYGTSIERLPESISTLRNLRTLILCQCKDLIELPTDTAGLISLWHLDIRGTKLQEMPPRIGALKNLHVLTNFIVSKQGGSNIRELGELQHLRRKLCIWNVENIVDAEDAAIANLKGKRHLKELELRWNSDSDNSVYERCVLHQLQPHENVECLSIFGYGGEGFPRWLGASGYSNMSSLKLSGCRNCLSLPPFGQLTSLKDLSISDFGEVADVGPEFYGSCLPSKKPFGSLITLTFERMGKWKSWAPYADTGAFPHLQELYIRECPNLIEALPAHLPSLTTLEIEGCLQLVASLPIAPSVLKMKLKDDSRDVVLKKLPSGLHSLIVDRFYSLDSIVDRMHSFATTLEEIEIRNHDSLKCFPLELFPMLKSFRITRCPVLESLFPAEGDFSCLSSLEIRECPNLVSFLKERLPARNLGRLLLLGCSNVESFPEKNMLPSTITSLKIWDFQNLKCLDYTGLKHLKSLRELEICNCPKLQSLPEEGLPSSLSSLSIFLCPQLEQRCQRETGNEWEKISLIPHVNINFHKIN
ncbi:putative disease resistance RPP13-like protein 1 [Euphorbia lathyris]|uniref:putative disease resistance RPP13-like protein 1 n=1 Tax=Euphorbia lathyris TaxID=212925 RepID=UPI0033137FC9